MAGQPSGSQSSGSQSSGSQSSGSQSSGPKDPTIPFAMHRGSVNPKTGLGTFHLQMPSSEGVSSTMPNNYPPILLEIKDDDQMGSLLRMKKLQHENILAVHFFEKDRVGGVRAFFEPYTGYIAQLFTGVNSFINTETELAPSQKFEEIVSASLDGLDCIFKNGQYHGNFSWETTAYHQGKDEMTLKLCNFEDRKNGSLLDCQIGDCKALAHALEKVSQRVKKEYVGYRPETCCSLDDLAHRLRGVNDMESLRTMKQRIQDHVFFWDGKRKRNFYAYEIPALWFRDTFLDSFWATSSAPAMPWNTSWNAQAPFLMKAMEKYRAEHNILRYNFHNRRDFLRFISGLYTHQKELELQFPAINVDVIVQAIHPRLLLDLKATIEVDAMNVDNQ